jgi:hypothetical protein
MAIPYILLPFHIFYGHLVLKLQFGRFSPLWYFVSKKSGNPGAEQQLVKN